MHELAAVAYDAVAKVGVLLAVAEVQQLTGALVDLWMSRHTPVGREVAAPVLLAEGLAGVRIGAVQVAALIVAGQGDAAVYHDVGG